MALDLNSLPIEEIADFCRSNGIRRLAIFGGDASLLLSHDGSW